MLDGIGANSVPPLCSKQSHPLAAYNQRTHFQIGVEDDKGAREQGAMHRTFTDPKVVYCRYIPPDKNASIVGMTQGENADWVSEQHARFLNNGPQKRRDAFEGADSVVHFGDDPREVESQYTFTHKPGQNAKEMPPNTHKWPEWPKSNVLTGAIRTDLEPRFRKDQNLKSQNFSHINEDNTNIRNPTTGVYHARPVHNGPTSHEYVQRENKTVHPLISSGAIRQRTSMDRR
ncbi:unnamed protein product [Amoebophrya sp. A120]|nr:unnamed protein product [Amoebophrya sp. A120]|eukprot:GSA120T00004859001.1